MTRLTPARTVGLAIAGAVLVGVAAYGVSTTVKSPSDAAAERGAPEPSLITVPVERRALSSRLVLRGGVTFAEPRPLVLTGAVGQSEESAGSAIVTRVPSPDAVVEEGATVLEVSGRPVFALLGTYPMYRTLRHGMAGDDVRQLEEALARLGHDPGTVDGNYDEATSAGLKRFYEARGYPPPEPSPAEREELTNLERSLTEAEAALRRARAGGGADPGSGEADPLAGAEIADLQAQATRARNELAARRRELLGSLPAGELQFFPALPVRIGEVKAKPGDPLGAELLTITDQSVRVDASVTPDDLGLVVVGAVATIEAEGLGTTAQATVVSVADQPGTNGADPQRHHVALELADPATATALAGTAVKVTIAVEATDGEVLVVPVAAVSTGADGVSTVEVQRGDDVERLRVQVGLSAEGYAEVTPTDGTLEEGDRVVIGTERS